MAETRVKDKLSRIGRTQPKSISHALVRRRVDVQILIASFYTLANSRTMGLDQFSILQVIILTCLEEDTQVDREEEERAEVELPAQEDPLQVETATSHTQMIHSKTTMEDKTTTKIKSHALIFQKATAIESNARMPM